MWAAKAKRLESVAEGLLQLGEEQRQQKNSSLWATCAFNQIRMLRAFVLENYAKGLILYKNPCPFINDNRLSFGSIGHDIISLLRKTGLRIDKKDEELLKLHTIAGEWFGRYPIPKDENKVLDERPSFSNQQRRLRKTGGKLQRGESVCLLWDRLHSGIGYDENKVYFKYLSKLKRAYKRRGI